MNRSIKKYLKYGLIFTILFVTVFGFFGTEVANAFPSLPSGSEGSWFIGGLLDLHTSILEGVGGVIVTILGWLLEWFIMPLMTWTLTVFGNLLDQAINFSLHTENISVDGLRDGWSVFRDVINMAFIFVLLYIAINTILGTDNSADKKTLANLVIAALFINFSFFITGLVIDVGNIFGLAFRSAIDVDSSSGGLGAIVMNVLNLTRTYEPSFWGYSSLLVSAVRMILVGITIYAFFTACVLFLVRIVSFVMLLILSPIGFIGGVLPKLKKYSEQWWSTLIGQTFVAPIFLFFFYVIARITTTGIFLESKVDETANIDVTYYFNFAIVIALILMAVKITKEMSGELGKGAIGFAKTAVGVIGGAALGGTAFAGRAVIGRAAAAASKKWGDKLTGLSVEGNLAQKVGANFAKYGLGKMEKGSFDARNVKVFGKGLEDVTGLKLGKPIAEGGFRKVVKDTTKKHREKLGEIDKMELSNIIGINDDETKKLRQEEKDKLRDEYLDSTRKPWWRGGKKEFDPNTPIGKTLRHVSAGGILREEIKLKEKIKTLRDELKTADDSKKASIQDDLNEAREKLKKMTAEEKKK